MPTVAVLGSSGFVGSHVTACLLRRGLSVRGTLRDASGPGGTWLQERLAPLATGGAGLTLHSADFGDEASIEAACVGCEAVFLAGGTEKQAPETVEIMLGGVRRTLDVAQRLGIGPVMIQSSTGSVNPPGPEPERKNELEHWSDPLQQISVGKYSPAAKTLMEAMALRRMEESDGALRVCLFNASLITGPALSPEPPSSHHFLARLVRGERMADQIPDGSMSMIDVRDLAALQLAALEQPAARGRYFTVKRSWHWRDILAALQRVHPAYTPPAWPDGRTPSSPTVYDLTRMASLGVEVRGLDAILAGVVEDLVARGMV